MKNIFPAKLFSFDFVIMVKKLFVRLLDIEFIQSKVNVSLLKIKSHMTCYNSMRVPSMPLIG